MRKKTVEVNKKNSLLEFKKKIIQKLHNKFKKKSKWERLKIKLKKKLK